MSKLAIGIVAVIVLASGLVYYLHKQPQTVGKPSLLPDITQTLTKTPPDLSLAQEIKNLESSVSALFKQVGKSPSTNISSDRLNSLETRLSSLEKRVDQLGGVQTGTLNQPASSQGSNKAPIYVLSLGSTATTNSLDWINSSSLEVTINSADYPNYKNMQLEGYLKSYQGNGSAFARLVNKDDGTVITDSELSTSAENYTWVASSSFRISAGSKTYRFQLKTSTGYEASLQSARIKVNF